MRAGVVIRVGCKGGSSNMNVSDGGCRNTNVSSILPLPCECVGCVSPN